MTRRTIAFFSLVFLAVSIACADEPRILVYTHNGLTEDGKKGYVHANIATASDTLRELGKDNGFGVDVSEDPTVFSDVNLKKYKAVVFNNTNNKAFDSQEQKDAFQRYIHAGGGFVGIHSATGSERAWPWYWQLIGGTFVVHAKFQPFIVKVVDKNNPSTAGFTSDTFEWKDEFYCLDHMATDLHVLLAGDLDKLTWDAKHKEQFRDPKNPQWHPLAWYHEFEGGRAFYTSLGHAKEAYADPRFRKHLLGGIQWAMGK